MKKQYMMIILIMAILSCSNNEKNDIHLSEIRKYDNFIVNNDKQIDFIDSMLLIYPKSEYFIGLKVMMLANLGLVDSVINYHNQIALKYVGINGTFMEMGVGQAIMVYQFENGWLDSDYNFLKSISLDTAKVNIWARIGGFLVNYDSGDFEKAEKYLLEAYEINKENSYVLDELVRFYMQKENYKRAIFFFRQIDTIYSHNEMKLLKSELEPLLREQYEVKK